MKTIILTKRHLPITKTRRSGQHRSGGQQRSKHERRTNNKEHQVVDFECTEGSRGVIN